MLTDQLDANVDRIVTREFGEQGAVVRRRPETLRAWLASAGGEHEADLILERRDRRVLAIEVKLAAPDDRDVRHLHWLREQLGHVVDAVVVTTGRHAYRRPGGIAVVPAALLGP